MIAKVPRSLALGLTIAAGIVTLGAAHPVSVAGQDDADVQAKITSATSSAPASISEQATILDYAFDDAGKFTVLREGSNGWSCFPDDTNTPDTDPMCLDATWLDWLYAIMTGKEPATSVAGLSYMLQGGSTPSNTDPMASEPAQGEEWLRDPPHIMLLLPGDLDQSVYTTDHHSGHPYIMWAGTPYEHIMVPVADASLED
jgi:hypothetical protein